MTWDLCFVPATYFLIRQFQIGSHACSIRHLYQFSNISTSPASRVSQLAVSSRKIQNEHILLNRKFLTEISETYWIIVNGKQAK